MDWYYSENGQQKGPVSESDLRALVQRGTVRDSDLVWREGLGDWIPVSQATELAESPSPQGAVPAPATAGGPAATNPYVPPQADGAAQPGYALQPRTAGTAIASLVCGICVFLCGIFTGIPAVICGHVALSQIKKSNGQVIGRGMAITGLVLGYLTIIGSVIYLIAVVVIVVFGEFAP